MIDKLWNKWKDVSANDPVKARLIKVLAMAGVIVVPFLTVWAWVGFAKAAGMVFLLGMSGLALLLIGVGINFLFGWTAHYIFCGSLDNYGDWLSTTILDEWEAYQHRKAHPPKPKNVDVTTGVVTANMFDVLQKALLKNKIDIKPQNLNEVQPTTQQDDGPEWLRKN